MSNSKKPGQEDFRTIVVTIGGRVDKDLGPAKGMVAKGAGWRDTTRDTTKDVKQPHVSALSAASVGAAADDSKYPLKPVADYSEPEAQSSSGVPDEKSVRSRRVFTIGGIVDRELGPAKGMVWRDTTKDVKEPHVSALSAASVGVAAEDSTCLWADAVDYPEPVVGAGSSSGMAGVSEIFIMGRADDGEPGKGWARKGKGWTSRNVIITPGKSHELTERALPPSEASSSDFSSVQHSVSALPATSVGVAAHKVSGDDRVSGVSATTGASEEYRRGSSVGMEALAGSGTSSSSSKTSSSTLEEIGSDQKVPSIKGGDTYFDDVSVISDADIAKAEAEYGLLSVIRNVFPVVESIDYPSLFLKGLTKDGFDGIIAFAAEYKKTTNDDIKYFLVENLAEIAYLGQKGAERIVEILKDDSLLEELLNLRKDVLTPIARMDEKSFSLLSGALNNDKMSELREAGYGAKFVRMDAESLLEWVIDPSKVEASVSVAGSSEGAFYEGGAYQQLVTAQRRGGVGRA